MSFTGRPSIVLALLLAAACRANTPVGALAGDADATDAADSGRADRDTPGGTGGREAGTDGAGGSTAPDARLADASTGSDTPPAPASDAAVDVPLPSPDAPQAPGPCEGGFLQWARGTSGSGQANVGAVAVSPDGTAWATGSFGGTVTFWAGQSGETTRTASGLDFYLLKISPNGALLRFITVTDMCDSDQFAGMTGKGLATLADGSVLVTGGFSKEITIGSTTLSARGMSEMFLARFHADGSPLWAVGTTGPCSANQVGCLGADSTCRHVASGRRVAALPDGRSRVLLEGSVAAYSAAGSLEWSQSVKLTPDGMQENELLINDFAVAPDGATFVVADRIDNINFGATWGQLSRFSGDGKFLWASRTGMNDLLRYAARSVLAFADGSAIAGGSYSGTAAIGVHTPYLARYESDGDVAWFRSIPTSSFFDGPSTFGASIERLVAFPNGGFVLVGTRIKSADTTGEGMCGRAVPGDGRLLLARYDANAAILWAKREGGSEFFSFGPQAATFADGTTLLGAQFYGSVTLGRGEPNETTLPGPTEPDGRPHAFVARFGQ